MDSAQTHSYIDFRRLGKRLAQVREQAGLTQAAFADALGVPRRSYVNYEYGNRDAPAGVLKAVREVFGTDLMWLMTGVADPSGKKDVDPADIQLVIDIVGEVKKQLDARGKALLPRKESRLVSLVYMWCRETGRFDPERVSQALDIAVGQ